jgi:hypothetical protein
MEDREGGPETVNAEAGAGNPMTCYTVADNTLERDESHERWCARRRRRADSE